MANPEDQMSPLETHQSQIRRVSSFPIRNGAPNSDDNQRSSPIEHDHDGIEEPHRITYSVRPVNLMREDGDFAPEEECEDPIWLTSRACFLDPSHDRRAYFFVDNRYVLIDLKPGTINDDIPSDSKPLFRNWPSLVKAGFGIVDAVLPNPRNKQEMYFFYLGRYALINMMSGVSSFSVLLHTSHN